LREQIDGDLEERIGRRTHVELHPQTREANSLSCVGFGCGFAVRRIARAASSRIFFGGIASATRARTKSAWIDCTSLVSSRRSIT